jgi:flagellar basal-body rod modification protein FlgD
MSTTNGVSGSSSSTTTGASSSSPAGGLGALTPDDFMQMLVTQLKNQDPLNPTSSDQILQQISEIDNIQATASLTSSLNSVSLGQSLATASNMIGKQVQGLDSSGNKVSGIVDSVSVAKGAASLNVGSQTLTLSNVSQVSDPAPSSDGTDLSNLLGGLTGS